MIRRHLFARSLMLIGGDAVVAALLFLGVGLLPAGGAEWTTPGITGSVDLRAMAVIYAAVWVTMLWYLGLYATRVRWTIAREVNGIIVASVLLALGAMSLLVLVRIVDVSRLFVFILLVAQPVATIAGRLALRWFFNRLRARGFNHCFMLVIGVGEGAQTFADSVEGHPELGIEVIGHLRGPDETEAAVTRPVLGDGDDLGQIFHQRVVDEVAMCVGPGAALWAEPLIHLAADEGKHVRIPTRIATHTLDLPTAETEEMDGLIIRSYVHGPARMLSLALKRLIDIAASGVGLVVLSPVLLAVAIVILVRSGRPIFFYQTRVGLHGRPFRLYKFRTMVADAEARYAEVAALSDTKGAAFKMVNDPRVTPLGAFLRRTSLDELPQLWNVVKGDMSLIGPRPAPPREVVEYDIWHRRRLSVKPGITGLWQVGKRLDVHFDERAHLDMEYIDRWTLALDFRILLRTVPAVLGRTGA